jgi:hypothetical protein
MVFLLMSGYVGPCRISAYKTQMVKLTDQPLSQETIIFSLLSFKEWAISVLPSFELFNQLTNFHETCHVSYNYPENIELQLHIT